MLCKCCMKTLFKHDNYLWVSTPAQCLVHTEWGMFSSLAPLTADITWWHIPFTVNIKLNSLTTSFNPHFYFSVAFTGELCAAVEAKLNIVKTRDVWIIFIYKNTSHITPHLWLHILHFSYLIFADRKLQCKSKLNKTKSKQHVLQIRMRIIKTETSQRGWLDLECLVKISAFSFWL